MQPLSAIATFTSSGNDFCHSETSLMVPCLITQRKRCMLLAKPQATSLSSFSSQLAMLPKLTYNTDFFGCSRKSTVLQMIPKEGVTASILALVCSKPSRFAKLKTDRSLNLSGSSPGTKSKDPEPGMHATY
ncbi:hypothetical protein Lal_00028869 [Lupinus albus]|nr:hypothetical protein Lal_00028869 [Lupinus albus]